MDKREKSGGPDSGLTGFVSRGLQTMHPYSDSELAAALPSLRRLFRARPSTCSLPWRWVRHEKAVDQTIKHYISFFPLVIFQSQARNAVASKFATTCGEPFQLFRTVRSPHVCPSLGPIERSLQRPHRVGTLTKLTSYTLALFCAHHGTASTD